MSSRDQIRSATLGVASNFKVEPVTIKKGDPQAGTEDTVIYVQQPSVAQRSDLFEHSLVPDPLEPGKQKVDAKKYNVNAVIMHCQDSAGKPVFDETDCDAIAALPSGGWYDDVQAAIKRVSNADGSAQKN